MPGEGATEEIFAAARKAIARRANEIHQLCGLEVNLPAEGGVRFRLASGEVLHGNPPLSFDLEPKIVYRLYRLDRVDLAMEHEVLAPEWEGVFDSDTRSRASRNLATVDRLAYLEATLRGGRSVDSEIAITHDRLVVAGNRIAWLYETPFSVGNPEAPCESVS